MNDLAVWIIGWDESGNERIAGRLRTWGAIPNVFTYTNYAGGEAENYNHCIRWSEEHGYKYMMGLDADVEIIHDKTIPEMYKWISSTPDCGSIRPCREGEEAQVSSYPPQVKYVDDGTALMWRLGIGAYWCEEMPFTGWCDLEFGKELEYLGYKNYHDRRWPVSHSRVGSNSHGSSNILQALKKRNKLLHDIKWYVVGRANWKGIEVYNATVPVEKRIPTVNQLVAYSNIDQDRFNQSVHPEHIPIFIKDNRKEWPNLYWENPIICGRDTRVEFFNKYGY